MLFSIDYLTGSKNLPKTGVQLNSSGDSDGDSRYTPSPPDTGHSSRSDSPTGTHFDQEHSPISATNSQNSLAQILLSLQNHHGTTSSRTDRDCLRITKNKEMTSSVTSSNQTEKPTYSYIALISMAILGSPGKQILLGDIYQFIMDRYPYYKSGEKAWRNSVRHNLSLNECFIKSGRAENGKGHYWSVHPACVEDFAKGDFRRRQARRRARKASSRINHASQMPDIYKDNIGYVPMTSSTGQTGYHPYASPSQWYLPNSPSIPVSASPAPIAYSPAAQMAQNFYANMAASVNAAHKLSTPSYVNVNHAQTFPMMQYSLSNPHSLSAPPPTYISAIPTRQVSSTAATGTGTSLLTSSEHTPSTQSDLFSGLPFWYQSCERLAQNNS